jgi:hypothetical protein
VNPPQAGGGPRQEAASTITQVDDNDTVRQLARLHPADRARVLRRLNQWREIDRMLRETPAAVVAR